MSTSLKQVNKLAFVTRYNIICHNNRINNNHNHNSWRNHDFESRY